LLAYQFAHRVFPRWFFEAPDQVAQVLSGPEATPHLVALWKEVATACQEDLPSRGLRAETVNWSGWRGHLIHLPEPQEMPEAHYVCAVWPESEGPRAGRIITLEMSMSFDGESRTVLGEWRSDGSHLNYGAGPSPEPQAFLTSVENLLT
jgi:hypothetical protein